MPRISFKRSLVSCDETILSLRFDTFLVAHLDVVLLDDVIVQIIRQQSTGETDVDRRFLFITGQNPNLQDDDADELLPNNSTNSL